MNIKQICYNFYEATYVPLTHLTFESKLNFSFPQSNLNYSLFGNFKKMIKFKNKIDYYVSDSYAFFGILSIDNTNDYLIIGPIFSSNFINNHAEAFIEEFEIPEQIQMEVKQTLQSTPLFSLNQCLNIIKLLNLIINKNEHTDLQLHSLENEFNPNVNIKATHNIIESKESEIYHNSYHFEQLLLKIVETGNLKRLEELNKYTEKFHVGKLSENSLRQQKNLFITTTSLVTRAAIKGGMSVEQAYSLSDIYIQECERMDNIKGIINLSETMLHEFVAKVARDKINTQMSVDVFNAVQYIYNHTNLPIQIQDITDAIGISYSSLKNKFKTEMGKTINEFITETKLNESKDLLQYTDLSLSEISSYLSFSSQSYFQNLFKKHYGITPLQYRKHKH